ncbi:MAG TPA: adenylate/guanylate cyclase domain-containing protein [Steroidobacteraceae bacterium]|nr:adenylate/guanylate cyclase domain-containing protein [Steroidobacteraceae bacterium]
MAEFSFKAVTLSDETREELFIERFLPGSEISLAARTPLAEAASALETARPDIILIDLDHSSDRALDVCRELKANPAVMSLPLIAVARTGRRRLAAFEAGVDDFITPQVRRDEGLVRMHALLRVSSARRQVAAQQLALEVRRREQIREIFRRYISPKLADQILADPELQDSLFASTNIKMHAAVMFADMRGFTTISEKLKAADVVQLLNEFFALLTDITFRYDGTVFNMAGDCLMVGFGVPVEQSDGPERAVRTAREMLHEFDALAKRWHERHGIDTGLGIGINVGEVVAGNIGSPSYMNYTIVGDTVNIASRLGQRARAGELLFSDAVKRSLDEGGFDIDALALPPLVLRGRSNPIDIFCVPTTQRMDLRGTA